MRSIWTNLEANYWMVKQYESLMEQDGLYRRTWRTMEVAGSE